MGIRHIGSGRQAPPSRIGTGSYYNAIIADSPWGFWQQFETSGGSLADSSGNGRVLSIAGSPTLYQTGPRGLLLPAVSWPASAAYGITVATTAAGAFTLEAWVYLTANPGSTTALVCRATGEGDSSNPADGELTVDSTGKVGMMVYNGSNQFLTASSALSLNTWHHVIGSVGAAGLKIRVDKTSLGTTAGVTTGFTGGGEKIVVRGSGSRANGMAAIQIASPAYYETQLSDARTDAHFDAA